MAGLRTSTPPLSDDSTEDITRDVGEITANSEIDFDFTEPGDISYTAAEHELLQALSDRAESSREGSPDAELEPSVVIDRPALTIPDPVATVRAPGSKLKTRPSATPGDIAAMAAIRRQVSGEQAPPLPSFEPQRDSSDLNKVEIDAKPSYGREPLAPTQPKRRESFKMKLDIPNDGLGESLGFGIDKEFDRVCENSKKGYLMRQSTKVVVASSRKFSDEEKAAMSTTDGRPPSSRNSSAGYSGAQLNNSDRGNTWTKEPWNGKMRGRSFRQSSARRLLQQSSAPPLPGAESSVSNPLDTVNENQASTGIEVHEDGAERGRLFVKVIGVKELDLPLPQDEKSWFQLTLDNGLHCVTTSWLELGKSAPIEQEFELVVFDDLEFQLTLQTKLKAPSRGSTAETLSKTAKPSKGHHFSRFLVSSKRRKEQERRQVEENEQANAQRLAVTKPTAWDLLHKIVGEDGSFARAYVSLEEHESQTFGRPYIVDVPCFNEWAVDDASVSSRVTKRGATARKPPYCIGKLRLQLLYVPKPVGAKDEDMPKSMNACIRELKETENNTSRRWEGFLSQQGGDCPYWRRRFFRLAGSKLTAHHETTMQPRATINLAKAKRLIDDRSLLTRKDASARGGARRKSAFAEEEEGYMFVEEGFRVRFGNGETIDFYAESAADKDGWMKVLADAVGKDSNNQTQKAWTALILARERQQGGPAGNVPVNVGNAISAAALPDKSVQEAQGVQDHRQLLHVEKPSQPAPKQRPMSLPKPLPRKTVPVSPGKQDFSQLIPSGELRHEAPVPKSPWHRANRRQQLRDHTRNKVRSMVL